MACKVVIKGKDVGPYVGLVVDRYFEMSTVEFIAARVNDYRARENFRGVNQLVPYKVRPPVRPEPELSRKV